MKTNKQSFREVLAEMMKGKDIHAPMHTQDVKGISIQVMKERERVKSDIAFAALTSEPVVVPPVHEHVHEVYKQKQEEIYIPWTFVKGVR